MRRTLIVTCLLIIATVAVADQLTVAEIVAAARAGATQDGILALINNPANTMAPPTLAELAKLREAGVSDAVIQAIQAKAAAAAPATPARVPDDPRLAELVKVVKSGLSEGLIVEQLKAAGEQYALTSRDLLYLKDNDIPESIIATLLARTGAPAANATAPVAGAAVQPTEPPAPPSEITLDGLSLKKASFLKKDRTGRLTIKQGEIVWTDASDMRFSFTVNSSAVQRVWAKCRPLPAGRFCYEVGFEIFRAESYKFRDVDEVTGSNAHLTKLQEALKLYIPNLAIEEKVDN